jgi:hypothetical protein
LNYRNFLFTINEIYLCNPIRIISDKLYFRHTPDDNSNNVLSKGIAKGFKGSIPNGGQTAPNSIDGDKEL